MRRLLNFTLGSSLEASLYVPAAHLWRTDERIVSFGVLVLANGLCWHVTIIGVAQARVLL